MVYTGRKLIFLLLVMLISTVIFFGCSQESEISSEDIKKIVDKNLETIISSPKYSSNPYDYIQEHQLEYEQIVGIGQPAFDYMLEKLEDATTDGLRSWIMASLCTDILGDKNPVNSWSSGKEWFKKYSQNK